MSLAMAYNMKRKRCMSKGGEATETSSSVRRNQKGIHESISRGDAGTSVAGGYVGGHGYGSNMETGKGIHRRVLSEMKADKTNRKNLAHGGMATRRYQERGVNRPPFGNEDRGTSEAGFVTKYGGHYTTFKEDDERAKQLHRKTLGEMRSMKGPTSGKSGFAEGGLLTDDGYQSECSMDCNYPCDVHMSDGEGYAEGGDVPAKGLHDEEQKGVHRTYSVGRGYPGGDRGVSMAGHAARMGHEWANQEHRRVLNEMKADKRDRKFMSEGGKVANSDELTAGFMPNEFDDLHMRDDLESTYTGANSGDESGDEQEDDDRNDMVARIMRSWAKRAGHNPRPA